MSDVGPPLHVVLGMLAAAILVVALIVFGIGLLVRRYLGPRARKLIWGMGGALVVAGVALIVTRQSGSTWMQAYGEELAFWLFAPGLGLLALALVSPPGAG